MQNIVTLDDYRPHRADYVACMACGKDWTAVYPHTVQALECPECGALTGEPVQIFNVDWMERFMKVTDIERRATVCKNAERMA